MGEVATVQRGGFQATGMIEMQVRDKNSVNIAFLQPQLPQRFPCRHAAVNQRA